MNAMNDALRAYLDERGLEGDLLENGLAGLVERWEAIVNEVERGYELTIDDYLNDVDLRDILAGAWELAPDHERQPLRARRDLADNRYRSVTQECPPLWGEAVTEEMGFTPEKEWWYFRRPRRPGQMLADDLAMDGLM
ncbi:MAG: hypothetical protein U0V87_15035 [Acidobacteriota bacterium]